MLLLIVLVPDQQIPLQLLLTFSLLLMLGIPLLNL